MNFEQDLKEVITKNLPQATGELLQQRLAQADKDAEKVKQLNDLVTDLRAKLETEQKKNAGLQEELGKHASLAAREEAVSKREQTAELEALKVQLTAAQSNTQFAKEVALGLVRNTEYRNNAYRTQNTSELYTPPGSSYPQTFPVTNNDTTNTTTTAS